MSAPSVFALTFASAFLPAPSAVVPPTSTPPEQFPLSITSPHAALFAASPSAPVQPESEHQPEFSTEVALATSAPRSGGQLYIQRLSALKIGKLYTRLPSDSFREIWGNSTARPTYEQWRKLLILEARAVSRRNSDRDLSILLGDSLSLWFPSDRLPQSQIWLNQGISGDTTWNILARLPDIENTRPSQIYLMAGVNDLKMGASDSEIIWNIQRILKRLRSMQPTTKIIVESILPTRTSRIPNDRIIGINQQLQELARQEGATYLDLFSQFVDQDGQIQSEYTTDGIHLSTQGYATWQTVFQESDTRVASTAMTAAIK
ncbi:MAG: GDSL-type esterase/lipase family protein [Leptolyngbya sp. Prado105]|jgi:lysophospholipase L1-like esterase|nr:GDSL-type esterase/lipase family protein [Leptolyngbya sp. Prado105]